MTTLRGARLAREWSREYLAARTGGIISAQTIYKIEQGRVSPRGSTRKVLADALEISVTDIVWPDGSPPVVANNK